MAELAGFTLSYEGEPQRTPQLFGWQVCLAHPETRSFEDASNYADYAVNRDKICQALGMGMAQGQNAYELDGQLFAAVIAVQAEGGIRPIDQQHPLYGTLATVVAEQLLKGDDHGMVQALANGHLVPFTPPTDAKDL